MAFGAGFAQGPSFRLTSRRLSFSPKRLAAAKLVRRLGGTLFYDSGSSCSLASA